MSKKRTTSDGLTDLGATTPIKGDVIWRCGVWSAGGASAPGGKPAIYTQKLIVESWGKKRATVRVAATGEMVGMRVYTDQGADYLGWAWTETGLAAPIAQHKADIAASYQRSARNSEGWLATYARVARPEVVAHAREILAVLAAGPGEIRVAERAALEAELLPVL